MAAARASLAAMPDAGSVEFVVGDATGTTPAHAPQLVVVNPPRRGIGPELAAWLDASAARHVIYSSCNVVSLARDLAAMPSLQAVTGRVFDMFPQTPHTEVMLLLERVDGHSGRGSSP